MEKINQKGVSKVIVSEMNYGMVIREVERFRHLGFTVSGINIPTTIPFSPDFIYDKVKKVGCLFFNGWVEFLDAECLIEITQNSL